eukprot:scaffold47139_cov17-Tisochrysis_lutea.AAC.1
MMTNRGLINDQRTGLQPSYSFLLKAHMLCTTRELPEFPRVDYGFSASQGGVGGKQQGALESNTVEQMEA